METNFEYLIDNGEEDEVVKSDCFRDLPYPIKVSEYDKPHAIDLTYPMYGASEFIDRLLLFKLLVDTKTTNKEAYTILKNITDCSETFYDFYMSNNIVKSMSVYDEDKLLFDKDNNYLEYIISNFISAFIDIGINEPKEADDVFKFFIKQIKLFVFSIYTATLVAIFTNDCGEINMDDYFDKYNINSYNKITLEEMKDVIDFYGDLNSLTEVNMYLMHNLFGNIMRSFYSFLRVDIFQNENNNSFYSDMYDLLIKTKRGKMIFNEFKHAEISIEHFSKFEKILLDYKKDNLCNAIYNYIKTIHLRSKILS